MQLLLRKLTVNEQGESQFADVELATETVFLGSAPNCDIQLLGEKIQSRHARIRLTKNGVYLQANKRCEFKHNGKIVKECYLKQGDTLEFESHVLEVSEPPPGFDFALHWQPAEVDGSLLANAYQTSLEQIGWRTRRMTWLIFLAVILCAGLVPLGDYLYRTAGNSIDHTSSSVTIDQNDKQSAFSDRNRATADSFWISGPLHSAHRVALGAQCDICHQKPFEQVTDQACESCHTTITSHVHKAHANAGVLDGLHCQNCHKEHNEPVQLVNAQDALCTDCHKELKPTVSGFKGADHPPFELTLLEPSVKRNLGSLSVDWSYRKVPASQDIAAQVESIQKADDHIKENSHLKFSHIQHLDGDKVKNLTSDQALACNECHQLSADQEHFAPIDMEQHCIACHELSFDPSNPKKQLPHGKVEAIYETLEAHFLGKAFNDSAEETFERRRLPAKTDEKISCKGDFKCAQKQAVIEADRQFSQRGCVTCHEIEALEGVDATSRWQVLPSRLTHDWFPAAHFNHQSHLTQSGAEGNALCISCHQADKSDSSHDVLIPGIENCLSCHGDSSMQDKVTVNCISCHGFHPTSAQARLTQAILKQTAESQTAESQTAESQTTEPKESSQ